MTAPQASARVWATRATSGTVQNAVSRAATTSPSRAATARCRRPGPASVASASSVSAAGRWAGCGSTMSAVSAATVRIGSGPRVQPARLGGEQWHDRPAEARGGHAHVHAPLDAAHERWPQRQRRCHEGAGQRQPAVAQHAGQDDPRGDTGGEVREPHHRLVGAGTVTVPSDAAWISAPRYAKAGG